MHTHHARRKPQVPLLLAIACCVSMIGAALAAAPQSRQRAITVTVLRDGTPVDELQPDDVIVREDGVAREIIAVSPAPPPTHIALLVDDSQAAMPTIRDLRDGLNAFTDLVTSLDPPPAVRLTTFGDRPTVLVDFNPSFSAVSRGIDLIAPRPGAGARLLEAIQETTLALRTRKAERPLIVAFVVEAGPEFSDLRHRQVREALERADASLWVLLLTAPGGYDGMSETQRERDLVIGDVTQQSGGTREIVLASQQLPQAFRNLAARIASRWQITYGRPDTLIPPERLEISGRNRDLRVLAPEWAAP